MDSDGPAGRSARPPAARAGELGHSRRPGAASECGRPKKHDAFVPRKMIASGPDLDEVSLAGSSPAARQPERRPLGVLAGRPRLAWVHDAAAKRATTRSKPPN